MLGPIARLLATLSVAFVVTASTAPEVSAHRHLTARGLVSAFACIHHYEGAWNDPGSPYWGGLQMDMTFQRHYGRRYLEAFGTADHWPPALQIAVAIKAYLSGRGFYPWPRSARLCGLLP